MNIQFQRIGRIFDPEVSITNIGKLSHAANPVAIQIDESTYRVFFNSRDSNQRSSVYSIDFDMKKQALIPHTSKVQFLLGESDGYFRDGVSLGSHFALDGVHWIGFMGWVNPPSKHWYGKIGKFSLDSNFNFQYIEEQPWFDLNTNDPISLSYPAVYFNKSVMHVWYGTTLSWDGGNGEMVHVLKEQISRDFVHFENSNRFVEWKLGKSQAFSRPSVISLGDKFLMAYSVRGNLTRYQIGFGLIKEDSMVVEHLATFPPSSSIWENEMVEYPNLISYGDEIYMFYNGNAYGKSGIGLAKLIVS
jgi:hypothetical protein